MPATTVMQGGVLPLERIAELPGVIKKLKSTSRPPSELSEFVELLRLDSPLFLSGMLRHFDRIRYTIASSASTTVITHPATSRNVATIRWPTTIAGETLVETQDLTLRLKRWLSRSNIGLSMYCHFKKYGQTPSIKWTQKDGEWEATDPKKQVLAVLVSRRSAIGTRLDITSAGLAYRDALVLTALLTVTGEHEWRLYSSIREDTSANLGSLMGNPDGQEASGSEPTIVTPPTYRQAPFTRPVGPLIRNSSGTAAPDLALPNSHMVMDGTPPALPPLVLTFSSQALLCGTFSDGTQSRVSVVTKGPYTAISIFTPRLEASNLDETQSSASAIQAKRVASIEWAPPSKEPAHVVMRGRRERLADIMTKGSVFASRKEKHFGLSGFIPNVTWTEVSRTSTASIYNDPNTSIRYTCRSQSDNRPLAVLARYTKRKGTRLELTPDGHEAIVEVILTALLVVHGINDWKEVSGEGVPIEETIDATPEGSLALGEEMISDLDGWAGPPELMRLRLGEEDSVRSIH
ncbi:hypothetical protein RhiJN_27631 [Ceratobasidium sp. AG-Ba]|nr:hypothetical protein RhiJN_13581 [Ceratobasidium sp. AG-Ba]QRV99612.1 hypothetical protein RhiJN_27631 [Ceratobasidium sp. AG-Ba]QRW14143.1 hypothetical protein RhiLY_13142 [Ceratobasidium sp. AG-Ba]